jgi:hypothetical protein
VLELRDEVGGRATMTVAGSPDLPGPKVKVVGAAISSSVSVYRAVVDALIIVDVPVGIGTTTTTVATPPCAGAGRV